MKRSFFHFSLIYSQFCFAQELWQNQDWYWLGGAAAFGISGSIASNAIPQKTSNAPGPYFSWDRSFMGTQNSNAEKWSNALLFAAVPVAFDARLMGHSWNRTYQEDLIYAEVLSVNAGLNLWVRSSDLWPRPEYYHSGFDLNSAPNSVMGSFYSGHASSAFALATSWYLLRSDRGDSPWICYAGYGLATGISILRVAAGKHYPTDVITGALIGTLIGGLITERHIGELHKDTSSMFSAINIAPYQLTIHF